MKTAVLSFPSHEHEADSVCLVCSNLRGGEKPLKIEPGIWQKRCTSCGNTILYRTSHYTQEDFEDAKKRSDLLKEKLNW
jgi:hypothetical protein